MWRAFFFAIGATLIISGLQCLVVDHLVVANGTRVPGFVAKFLDSGKPNINGPSPQLGIPNLAVQNYNSSPRGNFQRPFQNVAQANRQTGLSTGIGSRFGPSRFADSQFSNTDLPSNLDYYGGVPFSNRQSGNQQAGNRQSGAGQRVGNQRQGSQFSLAGYGGQDFNGPSASGQVVGAGRFSPVTLGKGGSRIFKPSEWMPWGLLAIGTLVVLYTNSTGRGFSKE